MGLAAHSGSGSGNDIYVSISIYGSDTPVTRPETGAHSTMTSVVIRCVTNGRITLIL